MKVLSDTLLATRAVKNHIFLSFAVICFWATISSAGAVTYVWAKLPASGAGEWLTAGNWNPTGGPPDATSAAEIDNGGTAMIDSGGAAFATKLILALNTSNSAFLGIKTGGQLTTSSGNSALALGTSSVVAVTIDGAGSLWSNTTGAGSVTVGSTGSGTLTLQNSGSMFNSSALTVGASNGSHGYFNVTGAGSEYISPDNLIVGNAGTGVVNISAGGIVSDLNGEAGITAAGSGTVTVDGAGSQWTNSKTVIMGNISGASGALIVQNGGNVTVNAGSGTLSLATVVGSTGSLQIGNGNTAGTITAAMVNGGFGAASIVFGQTDSAYTFTPKLTGTLSVTQNGSGGTLLTTANTYTGTTFVRSGTLTASNNTAVGTSQVSIAGGAFKVNNGTTLNNAIMVNAGSLIINGSVSGGSASVGFGGSGGTLMGSGTVGVSVTLNNANQILSPGNSPGILSFSTGQAWTALTYKWEINSWTSSPVQAGTAFDQASVTGLLNLTGATAIVLNLTTLQAGNAPGMLSNFSETSQKWTILSTTAGVSGFNSGAWTVNTSGFANSFAGSFSVTADSQNVYLNYSAAVPEPSAVALAFSGLALLLVRRRFVQARNSRA